MGRERLSSDHVAPVFRQLGEGKSKRKGVTVEAGGVGLAIAKLVLVAVLASMGLYFGCGASAAMHALTACSAPGTKLKFHRQRAWTGIQTYANAEGQTAAANL